jgi:hypothetical protein
VFSLLPSIHSEDFAYQVTDEEFDSLKQTSHFVMFDEKFTHTPWAYTLEGCRLFVSFSDKPIEHQLNNARQPLYVYPHLYAFSHVPN